MDVLIMTAPPTSAPHLNDFTHVLVTNAMASQRTAQDGQGWRCGRFGGRSSLAMQMSLHRFRSDGEAKNI